MHYKSKLYCIVLYRGNRGYPKILLCSLNPYSTLFPSLEMSREIDALSVRGLVWICVKKIVQENTWDLTTEMIQYLVDKNSVCKALNDVIPLVLLIIQTMVQTPGVRQNLLAWAIKIGWTVFSPGVRQLMERSLPCPWEELSCWTSRSG